MALRVISRAKYWSRKLQVKVIPFWSQHIKKIHAEQSSRFSVWALLLYHSPFWRQWQEAFLLIHPPLPSQALKLAQTHQQHGHIITDGSMSPLPELGGKIRLGVTDVYLCMAVQAQSCEGWPNFSLPLLVSCLSEKIISTRNFCQLICCLFIRPEKWIRPMHILVNYGRNIP